MRRGIWLFTIAAAVALLTGALAGAASLVASPPERMVDISGPCDEAEHANDPECAGLQPRGDVDDDDGPGDISGPCDEAEHANDPECTGVPVNDFDDDDGPGDISGPCDDEDDDDDDDRDDEDDDDRDDDDEDDPNSGSGGSGSG